MSSRISSLKKNHNIDKPLNKKSVTEIGPFDHWLFYIIIILCVFGLFAVFSASGPEGLRLQANDSMFFAKKQFLFFIFGFIIMIFVSRIDYKYWKQLTYPITGAVICLIFSTYIFGEARFGAERWLKFGPLTFQPSEFGKLAAILLATDAVTQSKTILDKKFIWNMLLIAVIVILILKQPSLSIALITSLSTLIVIFMGGFPVFILLPLIIAGAYAVYHTIKNTPYQMHRIIGWLQPFMYPKDKGYNIIQSWYAFGSGGIFGVGFGNSKQKLHYLPFAHTDFIFAVIAEEFGLIGVLIVISLFVAFVFRGMLISVLCDNNYGKLLAVGLTSIIGIQAFINMGVATAILPPTGITLPLISYGGSSSLAIFFMLGILLNISRKRIPRIP